MRSESAPAEPSTLLPALLKKPGAHGLWSMAAGGPAHLSLSFSSPPLRAPLLSPRTYQLPENHELTNERRFPLLPFHESCRWQRADRVDATAPQRPGLPTLHPALG